MDYHDRISISIYGYMDILKSIRWSNGFDYIFDHGIWDGSTLLSWTLRGTGEPEIHWFMAIFPYENGIKWPSEAWGDGSPGAAAAGGAARDLAEAERTEPGGSRARRGDARGVPGRTGRRSTLGPCHSAYSNTHRKVDKLEVCGKYSLDHSKPSWKHCSACFLGVIDGVSANNYFEALDIMGM